MKSLINKGLIFGFLLAWAYQPDAVAQSCPGGTFTTQEEVDSWLADNGGCTSISGSLEFEGVDIQDLSGFDQIQTISNELLIVNTGVSDLDQVFAGLRELGDDLLVEANNHMQSMSNAFPALTKVGFDINIYSNDALTSLDAFKVITDVVEDLRVRQNPLLPEITGFDKLSCVGDDLIFEENESLSELNSFGELTKVGHQLQIRYNESLETINGFQKLSVIEDDLEIHENESLTVVLGFSRLENVHNNFEILNNEALTTINGFNALKEVGDEFRINNNDELNYVTGFRELRAIGDDFEVMDNDQLLELTGFDKVETLGEFLQIRNNPSLTKINVFPALKSVEEDIEITDNQSLETISGFDLLETANSSLEIESNPSLREVIGFMNLTYVDDDFEIMKNPSLTTIEGFSALKKVMGNFEIEENPKLVLIRGFENLVDVGDETTEDFQVMKNRSLESIEGFDKLNAIMDRFELEENPMLVNICGFANILSVQGYTEADIWGNGQGANSREEILGACVASLSDCIPNCRGALNASLDKNGIARISPSDFIQNTLDCTTGLNIRVEADFGQNLFGPELIAMSGEFTFEACGFETLYLIAESTTTKCTTEVSFKQINGPNIIPIPARDVYCFDPLVKRPTAEKMAWAPCQGDIEPTFVTDWVELFDCEEGENDTVKIIYREWAATDKDGIRSVQFDTINVFQLPEIEEDNIFCVQRDTIYCGVVEDFKGPYFVIPQLGTGECDTICVLDMVNEDGDRNVEFIPREFDPKCGLDVFVNTSRFGDLCDSQYKVTVDIKQFCFGSPQDICIVSPSAGNDGNVAEQIEEGVWRCEFWILDKDTLGPELIIKGEPVFAGPLAPEYWAFESGNSEVDLDEDELTTTPLNFFDFKNIPYLLEINALAQTGNVGSYGADAVATFVATDYHTLDLAWDYDLVNNSAGSACANIAYFINGRGFRFIEGEDGCMMEGPEELRQAAASISPFDPVQVAGSQHGFSKIPLAPGDELIIMAQWLSDGPSSFRLYGRNLLNTTIENCEAHTYLPPVIARDDWSGIKQVKALMGEYGTFEMTYNAETKCYEMHESVRLPHRYEPYRVIYEVADSCHLENIDSTLVFVKDLVPPVPVMDKGLTIGVSDKKVWIAAEDIDENSQDNCDLGLLVVRRSDWATKCIDLCNDYDTACADVNHEVLYKATLESDKEIDEVEARYAAYLDWLATDNGPCRRLLYNAWQYDLIKEATLSCSPDFYKHDADKFTEEVLACRNSLEECFKDIYTDPVAMRHASRLTPELVTVYEQIGGGWSDEVVFDCDDVCSQVAVELLTMDYWCNWATVWTNVWVEDKTPVEIPKDVISGETISCELYAEAKYEYPGEDHPVSLEYIVQKAGENVRTAEILLDEILGGYCKAWPGYEAETYVDVDGAEIDCEIEFVDSICEYITGSKKVLVYDEHHGYAWVDSTYDECRKKSQKIEFSKGIILPNCAQNVVCDQDVWYEFNHCGEGVIKRTFKIYRSCGEEYYEEYPERQEAPDTVYRTQLTYVRSKCDLNKYSYIVPENVEILTCNLEYDELGNVIGDAGPRNTGEPSYKYPEDCRQIGIARSDKVFKILDGAEEVCYKINRTWYFADWCASEYPGDERWWRYDAVEYDSCVQVIWIKDTVPPVCTVVVPRAENGVIEASSCLYDFTPTIQVDESCGIDEYTYKLEKKDKDGTFILYQSGSGEDIGIASEFEFTIKDLEPTNDYRLKVSLLDGCGNVGECTYEFELVSIKKPTPICLTRVTAVLNGMDRDQDGLIDTAIATIWANEFDRSSHLVCGDSELAFKLDLLDGVGDDTHEDDADSLEMGCIHVGDHSVRLWVISLPSNTYDYCDVNLTVQPAASGCPNSSATGVSMHDIVNQNADDKYEPMDDRTRFVRVDASSGTDQQSPIANAQAWPNPFRNQTRISFTRETEGDMTIQVLDLHGRQIKRIDRAFTPGTHEVVMSGDIFPTAGVYHCQLVDDDQIWVVKVVKL